MPWAKWVFGAGTWTGWPSSSNNRSCHGTTWGLQQKSSRKSNSASSAPTHAKVEVAGLTNDLYTRLIGFSKKVLPQLAGPIIKIFWNFPRPKCKSSFTALLNSSTDISSFTVESAVHRSTKCCCSSVHSHFVSSLLIFQHNLYVTFSFQKKISNFPCNANNFFYFLAAFIYCQCK